MSADVKAVLKENLEGMRKSVHWLERSYKICFRMGVQETYTEEQFDAWENLVSRYARAIDVITNRVFRSIDSMELEESGTMIDVVNRAEKRGIITAVDRLRDLKDIRNDIVHQYDTDDLRSLFRATLEAAPEVFAMVGKVEQYCTRFGL